MNNVERTPMSIFIDHITHALNAWYEARYGERKKPNSKLSDEILLKFISDVDGCTHMFHSAEDAKAMEESFGNIGEQLMGLTETGIRPLNVIPKKKGKDYDA